MIEDSFEANLKKKEKMKPEMDYLEGLVKSVIPFYWKTNREREHTKCYINVISRLDLVKAILTFDPAHLNYFRISPKFDSNTKIESIYLQSSDEMYKLKSTFTFNTSPSGYYMALKFSKKFEEKYPSKYQISLIEANFKK